MQVRRVKIAAARGVDAPTVIVEKSLNRFSRFGGRALPNQFRNHGPSGKANQETQIRRQANDVKADLIAVVVAVTNGEPRVLTIGQAIALPSGPSELDHRSLQSGLRAWVERQTGHPLGYIEQLYTFADRDRIGDEQVQRVISISYLGLTREEQAERSAPHGWRGWYDYFPWEDHRAGPPSDLPEVLIPRLLFGRVVHVASFAHNQLARALRGSFEIGPLERISGSDPFDFLSRWD
ncbi:hypothetical protein SAMN05428953_1482 [Mesorhizobium muleiense]|uniref:Nudix hydrolase domain-containing protein n=1 Tax=Mesorhizobium muleiense TaxID=1004279 RepID=A0A1G9L599_9HYPH|nr:hypothetical protein SAMN05428953_1482 [Mesorhizobium muleiense]